MGLHAGSSGRASAPVIGALLAVALAFKGLYADPKATKRPPAAEYIGHVLSFRGARFVVHIDSFTPDEAANAVALAGRDGNSNAIRTALGKLDAGFIKLGSDGYRVAYARRSTETDGARIILILRNELEFVGRANLKNLTIPPLAAVDIWIPNTGDGQASVAGAATVVFRSADDVEITDWGIETVDALDLRERQH
jgi:hypothetical protein